ncbi:MAG: hypothetical protein ACREQJ_10175, partial [Candidatus Binatia bacterium]
LQASAVHAWGLKSHRFVNETAIEILPEPLRGLYRRHREMLSDLAVAPDVVLRKRDGEREAVRHYLNLEVYGEDVRLLVDLSRSEAERRFGKRKVRKAGLVPWVIVDHANGIERAIRRGDWKAAMKTSGYGGHYVADAFMPLHTTLNFDGQESAAGRGLHEALEHDVVDRDLAAIARTVRSRLAPPEPMRFTQRRAFEILLEGHADVAPLIAAHEEAARRGPVGSAPYGEVLGRRTRAIVERRLADAVSAVASLWLSAWHAAGRPTVPADALK